MEEKEVDNFSAQVGMHTQLAEANVKNNENKNIQYYVEEKEKTLAEAQLECNETLKKIYHLLRQDVLRPQDDGTLDYVDIEDTSIRILTDAGVEKLMGVMQFYVNKETLLSNFDDKEIARRMLEFSYALSANMFMKYELYFRVPNIKECKQILMKRIQEKINLKKISYEILNLKSDDITIKKNVLEELEDRIEYEMGKIKQEKTKENLREFELLFIQLKALVEAIHHRAWKGEERGSIRRHFNISEFIGNTQQQPQKAGMFKWI